MSPERRQRSIRSATPTSSRSPAAWPSESLTTLKRSRSTKSTATPAPPCRAVANARSIRVWNSARLASPVSESWKAWFIASQRLRVGQRQADVLGERPQDLLGRLVPLPRPAVGADGQAADDLAVLVHRDGHDGLQAATRTTSGMAIGEFA